MKKKFLNIFIVVIFCFVAIGCNVTETEKNGTSEEVKGTIEETGYIKDTVSIVDIDGTGINYEFIYRDEIFRAKYVKGIWKIYNSYKITISSDINKICQSLIDIHPIYGSDMVSYRTSDDLTYEWLQHNLAYKVLPEGNSFKNSAKDVDLDPKDQGKSLVEMYEDRTGQKLDLSGLIKYKYK